MTRFDVVKRAVERLPMPKKLLFGGSPEITFGGGPEVRFGVWTDAFKLIKQAVERLKV